MRIHADPDPDTDPKTSAFAGGVDSLPAAEEESNDDITEGEKDPSTSTRTRQVYFV
jgi:hypothetical protein